MQQRLISENMLQCSFAGSSYFTVHSKYIAFLSKIEKDKESLCIRIKTFNKQIKQLLLPYNGPITEGDQPTPRFFFSKYQLKSYLVLWNVKQLKVDLYLVADDGKQIRAQKKQTFQRILDVAQNRDLLLFVKDKKNEPVDLQLGGYDFQRDKIIELIGHIPRKQVKEGGKLLDHQGKNVFYFYQPSKEQSKHVKVFIKKSEQYSELRIEVEPYNRALLVYQDRFIFQEVLKDKRQIEIFDILNTKIIGKFSIPDGILMNCSLEDNILMIITNLSNIDRYHFYCLAKQISPQQKNLITNFSQYEKGKGSYFQLKNCNNAQASGILQGKGKISPEHASSLVSLIYMIPKGKQKVQVMKIAHQKLQQNNYGEQLVDMVVHAKVKLRATSKEEVMSIKDRQKVQMEHHRFEASKEHRKGDKNLQEIQAKLIQKLFDAKMKSIVERFDRLERKLSNLQIQIQTIYEKIERSIESINREEIKRNVEVLFEKVTPQFETYFNEVFRQIARVMDQGETYYKSKLAKEANSHRDALSKMMNMTFDATKEIIDLGHKELKLSESTEKNVHKLIQIYEKWKDENKEVTDLVYSPNKYRSPDNPDMKISLNEHNKRGPNRP